MTPSGAQLAFGRLHSFIEFKMAGKDVVCLDWGNRLCAFTLQQEDYNIATLLERDGPLDSVPLLAI